MAYIEKFFNRKLPAMLRTMFAPFLTILIMIPLTFCLIGPLGGMIGTLAGGVLGWLYTNFGALSVGILAALTPLIIMTGLHLATIVPYCILCMTTMGFDPMTIPAAFVINICLGVSAIAVGIKTKDNTLKGQAFSSGFTSVFAGIREPALFGINLKYMKPWIGFGIKILDSPRKSH
jgi:PTS system beta-glucosides-specific IIC component